METRCERWGKTPERVAWEREQRERMARRDRVSNALLVLLYFVILSALILFAEWWGRGWNL